MKLTGVIPARYASSRLPGKPLKDIGGKPMIWWVYQNAMKVEGLDDLVIATDDQRIIDVCEEYNMRAMMTPQDCFSIVDRLYHVSEQLPSDYYICIMGDEPLMEHENIPKVFPEKPNPGKPYVRALMRAITDPVEAMDPSNIKLAVADDGRCLYISRSPIPFPQKMSEYTYKKFMGVHCYNKEALDFYMNSPQTTLELIEDIGELRFIANNVDFFFTQVESSSISVDTPKDLEQVRHIVEKRGG